MEEFFSAQPPNGYGTQRALSPAGATSDADASILRQGVRYHQEEEYDLALVAFRAYFSGEPVSVKPLHLNLATTAALASGAYADAATFVAEMPVASTDRLWWGAMLDLRREKLRGAKDKLEQLVERNDNSYPAAVLLQRLP